MASFDPNQSISLKPYNPQTVQEPEIKNGILTVGGKKYQISLGGDKLNEENEAVEKFVLALLKDQQAKDLVGHLEKGVQEVKIGYSKPSFWGTEHVVTHVKTSSNARPIEITTNTPKVVAQCKQALAQLQKMRDENKAKPEEEEAKHESSGSSSSSSVSSSSSSTHAIGEHEASDVESSSDEDDESRPVPTPTAGQGEWSASQPPSHTQNTGVAGALRASIPKRQQQPRQEVSIGSQPSVGGSDSAPSQAPKPAKEENLNLWAKTRNFFGGAKTKSTLPPLEEGSNDEAESPDHLQKPLPPSQPSKFQQPNRQGRSRKKRESVPDRSNESAQYGSMMRGDHNSYSDPTVYVSDHAEFDSPHQRLPDIKEISTQAPSVRQEHSGEDPKAAGAPKQEGEEKRRAETSDQKPSPEKTQTPASKNEPRNAMSNYFGDDDTD